MIAFPFWDENPKILMRNAGFDGSILCKSPISKGIRKKQKLCKCLLLATPLLFPAPKILLSVGHLPSVPTLSPNSRPPHGQPLYQTHDQSHDRPIADSMINSITYTNDYKRPWLTLWQVHWWRRRQWIENCDVGPVSQSCGVFSQNIFVVEM